MEKLNSFEKQKSFEKPFEKFKQEIQKLQKEELEMKKAAEKPEQIGNPDLLGIKTEELTEVDMKVWEKYKKLTVGNVTKKDMEDFENYQISIDGKKEPGRKNFASFLCNKYNVLWGGKQLDEMKKEFRRSAPNW